MSNITNTDLQQLREFISDGFSKVNEKFDKVNERFDKVNERFDKIDQDLFNLDKRLIKVETRLEDWKPAIDKIPDLAEKVGELKNWKKTALIIISAIVGTSFGWVLRGGR
jgi:archaellum component FlaC